MFPVWVLDTGYQVVCKSAMPIVVSSALLIAMTAENVESPEVISAVRSVDVTAFPLTSTLSPKLPGGHPALSGQAASPASSRP